MTQDEDLFTAEHTRAILRATVKGYQAGENTDAKHWRQRAEKAEADAARFGAALAKIADPENPNEVFGACECEHDDDNCCAFTDFYCPMCIASQALKPEVKR